jgi:hypothetical protein
VEEERINESELDALDRILEFVAICVSVSTRCSMMKEKEKETKRRK